MTTNTPAPAHQAVLTDDEINDICERPASNTTMRAENDRALARATEQALLSKLRAPVADERISDETLWSWAEQIMGGKEAHHVGRDRVLRFARAALASAPVSKPKRAPLDDWRVQAIADCLETEWDDMSPDLAESYARTIVGYMIEYEKESDRIEAQHAAEPIHPVVQAVRNLRASAPVAGEAQLAQARLIHGDLRGKWFDIDLSGEYHDYFVENPGYEVRILYAAPQASTVAGEPFMYGVMGPDGKAYLDEFCVSADPAELDQEVVAPMNQDHREGKYAVVALFRDAAPQARVAQCSCPSGDGSLRHPCAVHGGSEADGLRQAINTFGSKVFKALATIAMADGPDTRKEDDPELIYREPVMEEAVRIRQAYDELSAALSAQPGAQKGGSDGR